MFEPIGLQNISNDAVGILPKPLSNQKNGQKNAKLLMTDLLLPKRKNFAASIPLRFVIPLMIEYKRMDTLLHFLHREDEICML